MPPSPAIDLTNMHIQNMSMPTRKRKDDPPDLVVISLRLVGAEGMRFKHLEAAVLERNKFVPRTTIIRELLELDPPDVLSRDEIKHFRQGRSEVPVINIPLSPDIGEKPRQRKKA